MLVLKLSTTERVSLFSVQDGCIVRVAGISLSYSSH
jgi:hypothetical protein